MKRKIISPTNFNYSLNKNITQQALALIAYAKNNPSFKNYLLRNTPANFENFVDESLFVKSDFSVSIWNLPSDGKIAQRRFQWLLDEIETRPTRETVLTKTIIATFRHYEQPKSPLFGIVGIAIIGPTLGLINSKKKKKNQMSVIFSDDFYKGLNVSEVTKTTQKITLRLLGKELLLVQGDTNRLMPETMDWLFSEQETTLATLPENKNLGELAKFLLEEKLSFEVFTHEEKIVALAISPTVSDEIVSYIEAEVI